MNEAAKKAIGAMQDLVAGAKDEGLGDELRAALGPIGGGVLGMVVGALTDVVGFERADQLLVRLVAQIKALQQ